MNASMEKEFRKQSDGKALNTVCAMILELQGKQAYIKGRPVGDFWKLRSVLKSSDRFKLNVLYDYLAILESSTDSLGQLFENAEKYRQEQQYHKSTGKKYDDITLGDVLKL